MNTETIHAGAVITAAGVTIDGEGVEGTAPAPAPATFAGMAGRDLARAFAQLKAISRTRPVTVEAFPTFLRLSVRITPKAVDHGRAFVDVPALYYAREGAPYGEGGHRFEGSRVLGAGVLTLDIPDTGSVAFEQRDDPMSATLAGHPVAVSYGVEYSTGVGHGSTVTVPRPDVDDLGTAAATVSAVIPAGAFENTAARVAAIASKDATRPILTGVLMEYGEDGTLTIVGTDSFRMHVATVTAGAGDPAAFIVPAAFLCRVARECKRSGVKPGNILITHVEGWTVVNLYGSLTLEAPDVDGRYPDHRQLIPDRRKANGENADTITLDTVAFAAAVADLVSRAKAAGIATADKRNAFAGPAVLTTDGNGGGRLTLTSRTTGAVVSATFSAMGDAIEPTGLNAGFLGDLAGAMVGDTFTVTWISPLRPITARSGHVTVLLMPVRLGERR